MGHKKSMRVFWLSLCLLLLLGTMAIVAVQYRSYQKGQDGLHGKQEQDGQEAKMAQSEADSDGRADDVAASFAVQPHIQRENASAGTQTLPASGDTAEYRFELKVVGGYLDVYHFHTDNLFFHTGIPYSAMPLRQRQELEKGKCFLNEQELYGYLESCTS